MPKYLWGYDYVTSAYHEEPAENARRMIRQVNENYQDATDKQIKKVLGLIW